MKGIVVGLLIAALVLSCAVNNRRADTEMQVRLDKMNEITALWVEIRRYRGELDMPLDPPVSMMNEFRAKTVKDARRVCAENHARPATCQDSCTLSDHICENAELICKIADELGKHDRAQEKCTSSKASCREAKQKCCDKCSKAGPAEPAPGATGPTAPTTKASVVTPKKVSK